MTSALILAVAAAAAAHSQTAESIRAAGEKAFLAPVGAAPVEAAFVPAVHPLGGTALLRERLKGFVVAAHQGGFFGAWPNTMAAFEDARLAGVDVVEMDLRASADGVAVVYHDDDLFRWTECRGRVQEKTLAELKKCRFRNSASAQIPTFEEVLDWSRGRVVVDAEFKDVESIAPALELVGRRGAYPWTYFQVQGDRRKYARARALDAEVALLFAVTSRESLDWVLGLRDDQLLIVEVDERTRTPENIAAIHAAGKLVTEDSWHFSPPIFPYELVTAACWVAYINGIDIAVSNRPSSCVCQRNAHVKKTL